MPAPRSLALLALPVLLAACAAFAPMPQPGQTEAEVLQRLGAPTGRYTLPDGGTRLEYATGPFGRQTWMVDVDGAGRVTAVRQVLGEASFAAFQAQHARNPQMQRDELLRTLGRPGERRSGGWQGGEVWSWRYPTNDCLWFQIAIGDDGRVRDGGSYGIDPTCDAPSDRT